MCTVLRKRPALSSYNETIPGHGTLHHTPCTFFPQSLLFGQQRAFDPCSWCLIHDARWCSFSRLYFVKVSLSFVRVLQAGEKGQTYRKWSSKKSCPTMSPSRCQIFIIVLLNINIKYRFMIYYFVICGLFHIEIIIFFTFTFVINEMSFLFLIILEIFIRILFVIFKYSNRHNTFSAKMTSSKKMFSVGRIVENNYMVFNLQSCWGACISRILAGQCSLKIIHLWHCILYQLQ